jgi:hypothetical protein
MNITVSSKQMHVSMVNYTGENIYSVTIPHP